MKERWKRVVLFSFECAGHTRGREREEAGEDGMEGPPVPIPNTEVKLHHADDTWRATAWKIRYLPALFLIWQFKFFI